MQGSDIQEEGNDFEEAGNDYGIVCEFCNMEYCLKTHSRRKCKQIRRDADEQLKRREESLAKSYEECQRKRRKGDRPCPIIQ